MNIFTAKGKVIYSNFSKETSPFSVFVFFQSKSTLHLSSDSANLGLFNQIVGLQKR